MSERIRLPSRRPAETFDLELAGLKHTVTVGIVAGKPVELFISNHKRGNAIDVAARDCGILISLCLQYGCSLETIAHALSRNTDGTASGVAAAVVDRVLGKEGEK
jgi:hypothetical protein